MPQGGTLTIRLSEPIPDLKPWDLRSRGKEYVADLLYNGLVRLDAASKPEPDLAEGWTTSPDGGMITFTLRSGLQWHDGTPLTVDDVVWTLNTLRTLTATNSLLFDLRTTIGDVRMPVSNTIVLSLTQAYAPLLADLAVPVLPRHRLQSRTLDQLAELNFWNEPLGSGPFKFVERNDQRVTFARNDQFFRGRPNLDRVALVLTPDPAAATQALNDGTLLVAEFPPAGNQPASAATTSTAQLDPALRRDGYPENGSYFLAFNVRAGRPFSDTRVREALALAVDVPQLVRDVTGDSGLPLVTSISPASWAFPTDMRPAGRDLGRAWLLLDEAGWKLPVGQTVREQGGVTLTARIFVRGDDRRRVAAAERIATAAGEIGIKLDVTPADFETVILPLLAPPYDFDLLLSSWANTASSAGFPTNRFYDPDDYALFGADRIWGGPSDTRTGLRNIGGFSNPDYEQEAQHARATYDPDQRRAAIAASQAVIRRELPYLFLWTDRIPVVASPRVRLDGGDIPLTSPRYLWNIERWYLE